MIGKILSGIFKLIISLVSVLLSPIDALIDTALPSLSAGLNSFNALIDYIITVIGYAVNASGLSDIAIILIVGYYTFTIGTTLALFTIKLALKWYNIIKP